VAIEERSPLNSRGEWRDQFAFCVQSIRHAHHLGSTTRSPVFAIDQSRANSISADKAYAPGWEFVNRENRMTASGRFGM
jgi:hypothetical protein